MTETQDTDDTQHQEPMKPVGSHGSSTLDKGDGSTLFVRNSRYANCLLKSHEEAIAVFYELE